MYRKSPEDPIFSTGTRGAQQTDSNIGRRPWAPPSAWVGQKLPPPQKAYNAGLHKATRLRAVVMRTLGLWLFAASSHAAGLKRTVREGRSIILLGPDRMDMQCESGCEFQPYCLPGPCSEDQLDAGTCKEEAVLCTDDMWMKCKTEACPNELRAELCARASGEVCVQRMGVQSYDRDAQAAQRAEIEAAEEDANPTPESICMSMSAESQDDWCTMVCNYDASSCDPKACRCGTQNDIKRWKKEKQKTDENLTMEPWDVENACDFEAVGCNQKLTQNCAAAANLTCAAHITNCMSIPHLDKNNKATRISMADCVDTIATAVDECKECSTPESKEAYALRLGPNAADPSAKNEAEAKRVKETSDANAKAFEGAKTATNNAKEAAIQRQEAAVADAIAAAMSPPPQPPQTPPAPPNPPAPPASPRMEAKDLLKANRKQAEIMYHAAKKERKAAEETDNFAKDAVSQLPPGDEQNDAKELADHTAAELSDATIKENNAKEFWDKAAEAEDRFLTEPTTRTPSGSMKTSGSKDIAKEEQRKKTESGKMAEDRQKEIDVEEKRKAKEASRRASETAKEAEGEAGRKDKATKAQDVKQEEIQEEEQRKTDEHDKMEADRIKTAKAEEDRKAAEAAVLETARKKEAEEAEKKKEAEAKRLEEQKAEEQIRTNEKLEEDKRKAQDATDLADARLKAAEDEQKRKMDENAKMAEDRRAQAEAQDNSRLKEADQAKPVVPTPDAATAGATAAHDDAVSATADAVSANDAAIAEMEARLKEAEDAQKAKTAENAKMEADRFAIAKAAEVARKKEHDKTKAAEDHPPQHGKP